MRNWIIEKLGGYTEEQVEKIKGEIWDINRLVKSELLKANEVIANYENGVQQVEYSVETKKARSPKVRKEAK